MDFVTLWGDIKKKKEQLNKAVVSHFSIYKTFSFITKEKKEEKAAGKKCSC